MSDETPQRKNIETAGRHSATGYEKGLDTGLLLPVQYADLIRRNHVIEGELKLLLAVLEDAIRCYLRNVNAGDGERRRDFVEVRNWFEAGGRASAARPDIFSFDNLCAALGIEPRYLLERLRILTIGDLPSRRYQMRRHRPLSSLRHSNGVRGRGSARSEGS
ncbi:MAG: hypothetical protein WBQ86_24460 [Candidatus Binatus sp.]